MRFLFSCPQNHVATREEVELLTRFEIDLIRHCYNAGQRAELLLAWYYYYILRLYQNQKAPSLSD